MQSKKLKFKWAESRKPERYSSAAPLSPNSNKKHILAEEEGTIISTNLCVIHDAILMLCEAFLCCQSHKTKDERAEPDDNSKYVVNATVAALILSIRTNRQIEVLYLTRDC
ncbi:unnamed protein product [Rhodiola kirilowii]